MVIIQEHLDSVGGVLLAPRLGKIPSHVLQTGEDGLIRLVPTTQIDENGEEIELEGLHILLKNHRCVIGTIRHGVGEFSFWQ